MVRCLNCMKEYRGNPDKCPYCGYENRASSKESFQLAAGTILQNRYVIGTVVSYGGFGIVYAAWDTMLDCKVAIKEYFPARLATREPGDVTVKPVQGRQREEFYMGRDRFLLEAQIMTQFDGHPHMVSIMRFFEENQTAYIVMEFLDGLTLRDYMKTRENVVDCETALNIMSAVCDITAELHRKKILHRDIAPDNIFLCTGGDIKLLDFGAARFAGKDNRMTKVLKMGYAPLEQYSALTEQGRYTDIYALGATLYRMLTGVMPEEATDREEEDRLVPPAVLNPSISEHLSNVVMRAMAMQPELRYQRVEEFRRALYGKNRARNLIKELKFRKIKRIIEVVVAAVAVTVGAVAGYRMLQDAGTVTLAGTSLDVWLPAVSGQAADSDISGMLEEFRRKYPQVLVSFKEMPADSYHEALKKAAENDTLPVIFYEEKPDETIGTDKLCDISQVLEYIDQTEYYFADAIEYDVNHYRRLPTGFTVRVLYSRTGAQELDVEARKKLQQEQEQLGDEAALAAFRDGDAQYLIAGADAYYQFLYRDEEELAYGANAGNVDVQRLYENESFGSLTDYWCVSEKASDEQKKCATVLLAYFMGGRSQELFFVDGEKRRSNNIPLYKDMFAYYNNGVSRRMDFLSEDILRLKMIRDD